MGDNFDRSGPPSPDKKSPNKPLPPLSSRYSSDGSPYRQPIVWKQLQLEEERRAQREKIRDAQRTKILMMKYNHFQYDNNGKLSIHRKRRKIVKKKRFIRPLSNYLNRRLHVKTYVHVDPANDPVLLNGLSYIDYARWPDTEMRNQCAPLLRPESPKPSPLKRTSKDMNQYLQESKQREIERRRERLRERRRAQGLLSEHEDDDEYDMAQFDSADDSNGDSNEENDEYDNDNEEGDEFDGLTDEEIRSILKIRQLLMQAVDICDVNSGLKPSPIAVKNNSHSATKHSSPAQQNSIENSNRWDELAAMPSNQQVSTTFSPVTPIITDGISSLMNGLPTNNGFITRVKIHQQSPVQRKSSPSSLLTSYQQQYQQEQQAQSKESSPTRMLLRPATAHPIINNHNSTGASGSTSYPYSTHHCAQQMSTDNNAEQMNLNKSTDSSNNNSNINNMNNVHFLPHDRRLSPKEIRQWKDTMTLAEAEKQLSPGFEGQFQQYELRTSFFVDETQRNLSSAFDDAYNNEEVASHPKAIDNDHNNVDSTKLSASSQDIAPKEIPLTEEKDNNYSCESLAEDRIGKNGNNPKTPSPPVSPPPSSNSLLLPIRLQTDPNDNEVKPIIMLAKEVAEENISNESKEKEVCKPKEDESSELEKNKYPSSAAPHEQPQLKQQEEEEEAEPKAVKENRPVHPLFAAVSPNAQENGKSSIASLAVGGNGFLAALKAKKSGLNKINPVSQDTTNSSSNNTTKKKGISIATITPEEFLERQEQWHAFLQAMEQWQVTCIEDLKPFVSADHVASNFNSSTHLLTALGTQTPANPVKLLGRGKFSAVYAVTSSEKRQGVLVHVNVPTIFRFSRWIPTTITNSWTSDRDTGDEDDTVPVALNTVAAWKLAQYATSCYVQNTMVEANQADSLPSLKENVPPPRSVVVEYLREVDTLTQMHRVMQQHVSPVWFQFSPGGISKENDSQSDDNKANNVTNIPPNDLVKFVSWRLQCHTPIVKLLGFTKQPFGLLLEYVDGPGDLFQFVRHVLVSPTNREDEHSGVISRDNWLVLLLDITRALSLMHEQAQLLHRDIKPHNILIRDTAKRAHDVHKTPNVPIQDMAQVESFFRYRAIVTDLGTAVSLPYSPRHYSSSQQGALLKLTEVVGTHGYTAPEVLDCEGGVSSSEKESHKEEGGYSYPADVYSLGQVMRFILEAVSKVYATSSESVETPIAVDWATEIETSLLPKMLETDPSLRPSMRDTYHRLLSVWNETLHKRISSTSE